MYFTIGTIGEQVTRPVVCRIQRRLPVDDDRVFIAAALDNYLRAFDAQTGDELWKGRLPAGGQATPMTYRVKYEDGTARQYVVIAAGGHAGAGSTLGDHVVAFALEE